jgi:hypothetical protein
VRLVAVIGDREKEEIKAVMERCCLSTKISAQMLFPERFTTPFSVLTDEIFHVLDDDKIQKAVIVAPRGWGKTSLCNMAYPAKKILFQEKKFIVPISNTATQAVMQGENLKKELLSNVLVKKIFGNVKSQNQENSFAKEMWVTDSGITVMPRGSGQQVRGILQGNDRPDLIICDDLEDREGVKNPDRRMELKKWFFEDVLNAVDRSKDEWKIVVIGTLLHEDSLLQNLMDDKSWYKVHIALCDQDMNSNWPDFMTTEEIKALAASYEAQGLLDSFCREYLGIMQSEKERKFKQEYFKGYDEGSEDFQKTKKKLLNIILVDPAKTTNESSDETAIVGVGVDIEGMTAYVRDIVSGRMHPDEQTMEAFAMADRLGARVIGLEVTSLNEFITYPWRNAMIKERKFYDLVELKARGGKDATSKEARVAALIPLYRMGLFRHNKSVTQSLEIQLLAFPRSKRWDIMDALAYIVEMLETGGLYFSSDEEVEQGGDAEFDELREDYVPALQNWRAA